MKTIKSITLGILIGAVATLSITALADYIVNPNPFPVKVNGVETAIEGYNINDSTFFKLRDVADAVGGFDVDFKDNTIVLETQAAAEAAPTPTPTVKPDLSPLPEVEVEIVDGAEYVRKSNIEEMLESIGLGNYEFSASYFYDKNNRLNPPLLSDMPHHSTNNELIPVDYYNSTVIPIINSLR